MWRNGWQWDLCGGYYWRTWGMVHQEAGIADCGRAYWRCSVYHRATGNWWERSGLCASVEAAAGIAERASRGMVLWAWAWWALQWFRVGRVLKLWRLERRRVY